MSLNRHAKKTLKGSTAFGSVLLFGAALFAQLLLPMQAAQAGSLNFVPVGGGAGPGQISVPYDAKLDVADGAFNIEMWVKERTRLGSRYAALFFSSSKIGQYGSGTPGSGSWALNWDCNGFVLGHSGQDCIFMAGQDATPVDSRTPQDFFTGFTDQAWHHIALSKTAVGGELSMYLDGLRIRHEAVDTNTWWLDGGDLVIGGLFDGYISNVRLVKGQALYTGASITVPTSDLTTTSQGAVEANVSLLLTAKGATCAIEDSSIYHFTINNGGALCDALSPATAFTVAFDNQGHGTKPADAVGVTSIALADLPAESTDGNFTFLGWSETATGAVLAATYTPAADATLYAIWQEVIPTATVPNIVDLSTADAATALGANFTLGSSLGTTAVGATALNNGKIATQSLSGTQNVGTTIDYTTYAYVELTHTVTYDLAGGRYEHCALLPTQAPALSGATFKIASSRELEKTGYTFYKWFDGTNYYSAGSTYTMGSTNITLTATWTAKTYQINWDNRGGSGTGGATSYVAGSPIQVVRPNPTKAGYNFAGWFTNKDARGSAVTADCVVASPFGKVTFFAGWAPKPRR